MFVLDTSILGILQRERGNDFENVHRRLDSADPTSIFVTIVSFHE